MGWWVGGWVGTRWTAKIVSMATSEGVNGLVSCWPLGSCVPLCPRMILQECVLGFGKQLPVRHAVGLGAGRGGIQSAPGRVVPRRRRHQAMKHPTIYPLRRRLQPAGFPRYRAVPPARALRPALRCTLHCAHTQARAEVVDYVVSYYDAGLALLVIDSSPSPGPGWFIVPFTYGLWLLLFASVLVIALLFKLLDLNYSAAQRLREKVDRARGEVPPGVPGVPRGGGSGVDGEMAAEAMEAGATQQHGGATDEVAPLSKSSARGGEMGWRGGGC